MIPRLRLMTTNSWSSWSTIASDQLKDGGDLVLLGDIFDLWRRDFVKALMESREVISKLIELKLKDKVKIHYLAGNHDYHMLRMSELLFNDMDGSVKSDRLDESDLIGKFPFKVTKSLRLEEGGNKFFFIHGYQLEVLANPYYKSMSAYETFSEGLCLAGDDTGNAADKLWETYETSKSVLEGLKHLPTDIQGALTSMMNPPDNRLSGSHQTHTIVEQVAISKARAIYLGMGEDEILVFGHTHAPFYEAENGVVNTGSWKKRPCRDYTYLEISDGQVKPATF